MERMRPRPYENIKEYALHWRLTAFALENPLEEVDMASTFLKSLSPTYLAMLVTEPCNGFPSVIKSSVKVRTCYTRWASPRK